MIDNHFSQATRLVEMCLDSCYLFHDGYQEPYATINIEGHREVYAIKSKVFRRWLANLFYETEGKVPNSNAINSALKVIEAKACQSSPMHELHNRVAWHDGNLYVDLTNDKWQAIKVTSSGWEIVHNPPIIFKRYTHQKSHCLPVKEDKEYIRELFNFLNLGNEADRQLLACYIATCLIPGIPHPILILFGPQGSCKTTTFKIIRLIIDPSRLGTLSFPREEKELIQKLSHHWFASFDNITSLPDWLSDNLCKAATGDGFSKRELYTDDDDVIYSYVRVIGLNGINIAATKADLLDRSIILQLERVDKKNRRREEELWVMLEQLRPRIFGALLSAISEAIAIKECMQINELPRMADFALWGEAVSRALGYEPMSFLITYQQNICIQNSEALQAHPVATAILDLMVDKSIWEGSASELLLELNLRTEALKIDSKERSWPKAAQVLTRRLNEIKPNLEEVGVKVSMSRDSVGRSHIILQKQKEASEAPLPSVNKENISEASESTEASNDTSNVTKKDVVDIIRELDKGDGAPYGDIYDNLPEPKDKFIEQWSKDNIEGRVFECRSGFWKVV